MSLQQASKVDHILVVDDTPDNLFLVQTLLEGHGYKITLAEDGQTALDQIERTPPDLILLDVMMPGIDGYEVTRRVRQNPHLPFIPILLITAHKRSSVVEGLDAGADDFIRKPMDIDELLARVRALLRLKHSIDEQQQMIRQREDFVSRLTHDLRTPLVAMDRMLDLIQQDAFGDITSDLRQATSSMINSNNNLLQMVNMILEVYRHDAGHKTLTYAPCDLEKLIHEVVHQLKPLASERGIDLRVDLPKPDYENNRRQFQPLPAVVMGDYLELRRVLTNLIGNAIKFTEEGFVSIRLEDDRSSQRRSDQPSQVKILVQDTGTGISLEDQAKIFERFRQGNHKRAGSGLGLYLSRRIIEAHQGTIEVESEIGKGSIFTIHLPVSLEVSAQPTASASIA